MSDKKRSPKEIAQEALEQEIQILEAPPHYEHPQPIKWGSWDLFWHHIKRKHRLSNGMEIAIKTHFEVKGFNRPELFEKGIRDFGLEP